MNINADVRIKQLENLEYYISSSRDKVQSILDCLKWNIKEVSKDDHMLKCSVDFSHRVSKKSFNEHTSKCFLKQNGYSLNENFLSEPVHDINSSVIIDDQKKIEILSEAHRSIPGFKSGWNGQDPDPKTADRLTATFSSDERAVLHSYAIQHTVGPPELPEFNIVQPAQSNEKCPTRDELRIRERDAKRRRIKYKSIHTNRKNHTEVMREVINGQMELYVDWLVDSGLAEAKQKEISEQYDNKTENQEYENQDKSRQSSVLDDANSDHSNSVISKNTSSTHSDTSKSTSGKYKMDKHECNLYKKNNNHYYGKHRSREHNKSRERCSDGYKRRRSRDQHDYNRKYQKPRTRERYHNKYKRHEER